MIFIIKLIFSGGNFRLDWLKKGKRPTGNMAGKLFLFGSLPAKFSKEINLRVSQVGSNPDGEKVWPDFAHYP
jgi:hypothetical protein